MDSFFNTSSSSYRVRDGVPCSPDAYSNKYKSPIDSYKNRFFVKTPLPKTSRRQSSKPPMNSFDVAAALVVKFHLGGGCYNFYSGLVAAIFRDRTKYMVVVSVRLGVVSNEMNGREVNRKCT